MKILLVATDAAELQPSVLALSGSGFECVQVPATEAGLDVGRNERPDIVLLDLTTADGLDLVERVRRRLGDPAPAVLVSGPAEPGLLRAAMEADIDDYLVKPLLAEVLSVRLHSLRRTLIAKREADARALALERYHQRDEADKRIAMHLIDRLISKAKLDDTALHHWLLPAGGFSGDVIAAARTPANVLHVLLADGTGHGLAASINVLPVAPPFYSMTEKGFAIDTIARELNDKVRRFLPTERFVAATLAALDFREGVIHVWNGGNPDPMLIAGDGSLRHVFRQGHVPLGVLDNRLFDPRLETVGFEHGEQLLVHSDGLVEAHDPHGAGFGSNRVAMAMQTSVPSERLARLQDSMQAHLAGNGAADDISVVMVDCAHDLTPIPPDMSSAKEGGDLGTRPGRWGFSLRLGAVDLRRLDVVPMLLNLTSQFDDARAIGGRLFVVLSEFFNNALDHGLLRLDSRLKLGHDGMSAYLEQRAIRLQALDDGEIEISMEHVNTEAGPALSIRCRDSGAGFPYSLAVSTGMAESEESIPNELPFGRGLTLVRNLSLVLEFNASGNEARAVLALCEA